MLVCVDARFVEWRPDFSEIGIESPNWTKLVSREIELCNSIEWVQWNDDPVQVQLCEVCGQPGCWQGYVCISQISSYLIWGGLASAARNDNDEWAPQTENFIEMHGPVVIPIATWERWRESHESLPSANAFRQTTSEHIKAAWLGELRSCCRTLGYWSLASSLDSVEGLFETLSRTTFACETLSEGDALEKLREISECLFGRLDSISGGKFDRAQTVGATTEGFYLDLGGTQIAELPLLACKNGSWGIALGRDWVYLPSDE